MTTQATAVLEYLKSLNFKSDDIVCIGMGRNPETLKPGEKDWENFFQRFDSLTTPRALDKLIARNEAGQNIYISMAPFVPGTEHRVKEKVSEIRHAFIETDVDGPGTLAKITEHIVTGLIPEFAVAVESSPGKLQAIWHVSPDDFISDGKRDIAKHEALIKTLQQRFNSDPQSTDTARFLRVPGFKNHNYEEKPVSRSLSVGSLTKHRLTDFKIDVIPTKAVSEKSFTWMDEAIEKGSRNGTLAAIGGATRNLGFNAEDIYALLSSKNEKQCSPPLPDDEIRTIANSVARYEPAKTTLKIGDKPLDGPDAIAYEAAMLQKKAENVSKWQDNFKAVKELEEGEVRMLINGFLPEGTTFIGALPGEGKTLLALSIVKALTTGAKFLGKPEFSVPGITPVIYLIPESGGRAFRKRCEKFHIPSDRDVFVCRTISEGATLPLDDASLIEAVRIMRPVVILDTVIRFSESSDENAAMQNKQMADDIIKLRQMGAIGVIGLHHSAKSMRESGMTLENVLRGTGDLAAMADAVYGLMRDGGLYENGYGPNEIDIRCLKPRDFDPPLPFRIAATRKTGDKTIGHAVGIESVIDAIGDFSIVGKSAAQARLDAKLVELVRANPEITLAALNKETGVTNWEIRKALGRLGWTKKGYGKKTDQRWTKTGAGFTDPVTVPVESDRASEPLEVVF
jgi:hypothetical protein